MNLIGNRRASPARLAVHLMNAEDNEHVHIHEMRGFIADDLHGAYYEAYGISRGTRCKKFLYSLSLNPPHNENVPIEVFEVAIEKIERKLGFTRQPRTIVFHEKKGRRHAHVVWSRIDAATMTAIDPYQDKLALNEIGRELFIDHGWDMPDGYKRKEDADPLNYSHAQHQQGKRAGYDPKELKKLFADCWERSDTKASFASALKEHGFILARGDRRAFVAVDAKGEVYSIARWVGIKAKEVRARFGECDDLPTIEEALGQFEPEGEKTDSRTQADFERETKLQFLEAKRLELVGRCREARSKLHEFHETRRIEENTDRACRIPNGLKAVWSKLSGSYELLQRELEGEAKLCDARDLAEYQTLIEQQLQERKVLQQESEALRTETKFEPVFLKTDPAQKLIIPVEPEALTNRDKVNNDPAYILNVITQKRETFTRPVIVRALAEFIEDPLKLGLAVDIAMRSDELVEIQSKPLLFYSTRDMLATKQALSDTVTQLCKSKGSAVSATHVNSVIAHQNNELQAAIGVSLSKEQEAAIRHCLNQTRVSAVVGLAGAGKSTMLSAVKGAYQRQGLRVIGAALSGKAADGLDSASGIESRTLASWKSSWDKGFNQLTKNDVLVIDEAGMIDTRLLKHFIDKVHQTGAKIILVGDPEQLQPINAGTPFREIVDQIGAVHLIEIHRQSLDWQKQASLDFAERRTGQAIDAYELYGNVKQAQDNAGAILNLVEDYMSDLSNKGLETSRLALAYRRKDVFAINQAIRSARQELGDLKDSVLIPTVHGTRAFAPDDRVLFTRNNHELGIRNGMIGTIQSVSKTKLTVKLDANDISKPKTVTVKPTLYKDFDHGYATTIHKSQGATIDNTYVLGSALMDRHLTYVAMTRHQQGVKLYGDHNSLQKMRRSGEREDNKKKQKSTSRQRPNHGPKIH